MVRRLLVLNGIAAIAAVGHHAIHWVLNAMVWWADRYRLVSVPNYDMIGGWQYQGLRFIDQLALLGVPSFLFISGFFLANSTSASQKTISWRIVLNRIRVILIPYIIWVLVLLSGDVAEGVRYSASETFRLFATGSIARPYYYVPLLLQLFLLSFILIPIARDHHKALLWIAFLLQIPVISLTYLRLLGVDLNNFARLSVIFADWHVPGYLMWLVLGMVAGFHKQEFKGFIKQHQQVIFIVFIVSFFLGIVEWTYWRQLIEREWLSPQITLIDKIFTIFFLLSFFSIENLRIPYAKSIEKIGTMSYGIYLIHVPVLEYTSRLIYHLIPNLLGSFGMLFLLLTVLGALIPIVMMEVVNRSPVRRIYQYIFG